MLTQADLSQFIGTEHYYRHFLPRIVYTDGVRFLAEKAKAYWLIDAIASHQINPKIRRNPSLQEFQVWKFGRQGEEWILVCYDNDTPVVIQKIEYSDFPLDEVTLYLGLGETEKDGILKVIMLPSEY